MEYLDTFAVGVGMKYYEMPDFTLQAGDIVEIGSNHMIFKDGKQIASVASKGDYYAKAIQLLDTFIHDNTHQLIGDGYVFLQNDEIYEFLGDEHHMVKGEVIYSMGGISIIYLATVPEELLDDDDDATYVLTELGRQLAEQLETHIKCEEPHLTASHYEVRKEDSHMDNIFGKIGFGKCTDSRFALSMNGIAVRQSSGKFVVYNPDTNEFVDTENLLLNIQDALFVLPAINVEIGDTIIHEGKPYYITDTKHGIKAVSYEDCVEATLIPKTTMFGLKYFTKVFSIFGDNFAATGDLFSNPMMLMALMDNKNADLSKLMLFSTLGNNENMNPMFLSLLLKDGNTDLSTIAMMSMFNGGKNPFTPSNKKKATDKDAQ